jgi:predicted DsbA family dithiol-disulfide isomerase/uncharacterized membrane protein
MDSRETSGSWPRTALALAPVVTGLAASALLLVDYVRPSPVFCDAEGACAKIRQTAYAAWFGVPTPAIGIAGFLLLLFLTLQRGPVARIALAFAASGGALFAALFLKVQLSLATWCPFCCVADGSALVVFALAWWRQRAEWDPPEVRWPRVAVGAVAMVPAIAALVVGATKRTDLPAVIADELARSPAGKVTVIDFADFECPWCRLTHAQLAPLLQAHRDRVRVVRKQVPLERMHPHALTAARAACCGEQLGRGDAMADALFSAPVEDLTDEGCAKLAASLGLDGAAFQKCVQDPRTEERIRADQAAFKASKSRGLPTLWIGEEKIEGAQGGEELEKALTRAIASRS